MWAVEMLSHATMLNSGVGWVQQPRYDALSEASVKAVGATRRSVAGGDRVPAGGRYKQRYGESKLNR